MKAEELEDVRERKFLDTILEDIEGYIGSGKFIQVAKDRSWVETNDHLHHRHAP